MKNIFFICIFTVWLEPSFTASEENSQKPIIFRHSWDQFEPKYCGDNYGTNKISGGTLSSIEENPWHVGIISKVQNELICSGNIISKWHVLTMGYCLQFRKPSDISIVAGVSELPRGNLNENSTYQAVDWILSDRNTKYSMDSLALILIKNGFRLGPKIYPICLPTVTTSYAANRVCRVSGWSQSKNEKEYGAKLQYAVLQIWPLSDCQRLYFNDDSTIGDKMFCAGDKKGEKVVCDTDSGGPLACLHRGKRILSGIIAWGKGCEFANFPTVFTKISEFLPWIHEAVAELAALNRTDLGQIIMPTAAANTTNKCRINPTNQFESTTSLLTWRDILPTFCGSPGVKLKFMNKITEGELTDIENSPWQVGLVDAKTKKLNCGGTIISKRHVLTAAHCFVEEKVLFEKKTDSFKRNKGRTIQNDEILVYAGSANISNPLDRYEILDTFVHSRYHPSHHRNDIALIMIDGEFVWSTTVSPICLPSPESRYEPGRTCTVTGWGKVDQENFETEQNLHSSKLKIIDDKQCQESVENYATVTRGMFCAGDYVKGGVDTCQGDSGGPLFCDNQGSMTQYGITSWGRGCGDVNSPGIYTKVSKYIQWIRLRLEISVQLFSDVDVL